jgi:hypothetical protein
MEIANHPSKSYKFDFWKDHFWVWALALPFGLIGWAVPFVVYLGLSKANNAPGWFPIFGFIFLGIPCYFIGWIFVYSLMEGIYTKVTVAEDWILVRLPWVVFPLIPVIRRIELARIRRVNLQAPYGSRAAVFLYYYERNKERHYYLPRFEHNIPYIRIMMALKDRIEPPISPPTSGPDSELQGMRSTKEGLIQGNHTLRLRRRFIDKALYELTVYSFLALLGISGWITLSLPASSKIEAFVVGSSFAIICLMVAVACSYLPAIGPIAFWFLGHWIIRALLWLLQVPDASWDTPPVVNQLLALWNISPIHSTLVEFFFWATLFVNIELSLGGILSWFERRAQTKLMRSPAGEITETRFPG